MKLKNKFSILPSVRRIGRALWSDDRGQDLIEYALLAGFIAVAVAAIFPTALGPNISTIFSKVGSSLTAAGGGA
jgi:pilus assembly protein Flp/PilA